MIAALRRYQWLALALCIAFVFLQYIYVRNIGADVAYMDTLRYLGYYSEVQRGEMSLWDTWNQGEHRGLVFQIILWINARFFSLDILGINTLSAGVIAVTSLLLAFAMIRSSERSGLPAMQRHAMSAIAVLVSLLAGFSLAGFELLTLDLGFSLFLKNLCFIIFWFLFDAFLRNRIAPDRAWLLALSGLVIVLVIAMGWSYSFVLASLAIAGLHWANQRGRGRVLKPAFVVAAVLLLALLSYVWIGGGVTTSDVAQRAGAPASPLHPGPLLTSFALALSSAFLGTEIEMSLAIPQMIEVGMGALLALATIVLCVRRALDKGNDRSAVPYALMVYGMLCAASVAVSRGRYDVELTKASRYFMDYGLIVVGLLWASIDLMADTSLRRRKFASGMLYLSTIVALVFLGGQTLTYIGEWRKAPYRAEFFKQMRATTLNGSTDPAKIRMLQSPQATALNGIRVQREAALGPFRGRPKVIGGCTLASLQPVSGWHAPEATGRWVAGMSRALVSGCRAVIRLSAYAPSDFQTKELVISVDGTELATKMIKPNESISIDLPINPSAGQQALTMKITPETLPGPESADIRPLGLFITGLESR